MSQDMNINTPYICVKSLEKGVSVIGVTRGEDTKFHHTEKLDAGELLVAQFTENTSAVKIRGKAEVYTQFGKITTGDIELGSDYLRRTKIVCTLGPTTEDPQTLKKLILAGMDVARINFSHGDHTSHGVMIEKLKKAREELNAPVALILDTKGPEIRIKTFGKNKVYLQSGETFTLTTEEVVGDEHRVSVTYERLPQDLAVGARVLLDDGLVELHVEELTDTEVRCRVVNGGFLSNNKGVNIPDVYVHLPALTERDIADLKFGIKMGFDYVAASFIRSADDVRGIRKVLEENGGGHLRIIAKIENREGVDHIDEILEAADSIMVARGDLGVEIPPEEVPQVQKMLIRKANQCGKPVITATQMLESMVENPRPTRAEASDVANAIYDGSDAIMLSGETAKGKYPLEAVAMMARIAVQTESNIDYVDTLSTGFAPKRSSITNAIGHAAASIAAELGTSCIATVTKSGFTARMVARFRPVCPIVASTTDEGVWRQLNLVWGCIPVLDREALHEEAVYDVAMNAAVRSGAAKAGDLVVMSMGIPVGVSGSTNALRVSVVEP